MICFIWQKHYFSGTKEYKNRKFIMSLLNKIRKIFWKININIDRFTSSNNYLSRRIKLLNYYNIDIVLDIGANIGQYGSELRDLGYKNTIVSFEPLKSEFKDLEKKSYSDSNWSVFNHGLGSKEEQMQINIAENSYSSSILEILPKHTDIAPESNYVGKELIKIKSLDSIFDNFCDSESKVYMKIDTQGFEKEVLIGAKNSLQKIDLLQIEMSLVPLYENESSFIEMLEFLTSNNFCLVGFESGFIDNISGELLQVDGLFKRSPGAIRK